MNVSRCDLFRGIFRLDVRSRLLHEWSCPQGYDTGITVFNSVTKKDAPLILENKHLLKWYICGPTVYDVPHIGHASSYIRFDIIRRILERFFDIKPVVALGITDIDDKIILRSKVRQVDFKELVKEHELEFFKGLTALNIQPPTLITRVTEHIPEVINFVSKIIDKGQAYVVEDGSVYFDTSTCDTYGKLMLPPSESQGALQKGQKAPLDFALWKGAKPGEPFWESPWGKGRPGWHIECSAMASKYFGSKLDMHSGGVDLIFPHHENEEAQSCTYHGCQQWVNYWVHSGHLKIQNEKMSKSLNNFISISDCLEKYTSDHLRMLCFKTHYKSSINYTEDSMKASVALCEKISSFLSNTNAYIRGNWYQGNISEPELLQALEESSQIVKSCLANNFDTPGCLASILHLVDVTGKMIHGVGEGSVKGQGISAIAVVQGFVRSVVTSLGFQFQETDMNLASQSTIQLQYVLDTTLSFRSQVRSAALSTPQKETKKSLLKACDYIRDEFKTIGIGIQDHKSESSWSLTAVKK